MKSGFQEAEGYEYTHTYILSTGSGEALPLPKSTQITIITLEKHKR
jgi:hypothetical protein